MLPYGLGDQAVLASRDPNGRARPPRRSAASPRGTQAVTSPDFLTILALLVACALAVAFFMRRRRPLFDLLSVHLARHGIEVGPSMTMEEALQRLRSHHPEAARELEPLIALYEEERFSSHEDRGSGGTDSSEYGGVAGVARDSPLTPNPLPTARNLRRGEGTGSFKVPLPTAASSPRGEG